MSRAVDIRPLQSGANLMVAWRLVGRRVLIVGGGEVAAGRARLALEADAEVTVVAPELGAKLRQRASLGQVAWRARGFVDSDLDAADMVMSAIDDGQLSRRIASLCRSRRIPVNVADVPHLCDFWLNAVYRDGPVQIAVSSGGNGPGMAARLVRELGAALPRELGQAVHRFGQLRRAIRERDPAPSASGRRMSWLGAIGRGWSYASLAALGPGPIERLAARYSRGDDPPAASVRHTQRNEIGAPAAILLVGAGPGDPELLTLAAVEALESADVVIADRLVPPAILARVKGQLKIARKHPGQCGAAQIELEEWVLQAARAGQRVVRLKAGDPTIFGRAGEELRRFAEAGFEVRVIPGISSVVAASAASSVPLTLRHVADRFRVITGQGADGAWPDTPDFCERETLVVLMAVGRAGELAERLRQRAWPAHTPVVVVERATRPDERVTRTRLDQLAAHVQSERVRAPAVLLIGEVAGLSLQRPRQCAPAQSQPLALKVVGGRP